MTQTIATTLAALRNVGNAPVTVRLHAAVLHPHLVKQVAARHRGIMIADIDSAVTITLSGPDSWDSLRRFAEDLLAGALESQ